MSPRAELDDRLIDQALERHFAAPPPDLAPRVVAALASGTPSSLDADEVARLLARPEQRRARPWLVLAAAAALVAALFWLLKSERPAEPARPPLATGVTPVSELRFEALLSALFVPGGHPPVQVAGEIERELIELDRALSEQPARWPRLEAALLAPNLVGAAVAPLDFLHMIDDPRALPLALELWRRDPSAFADIHVACFAEFGDPVFRAALEALLENAQPGRCTTPVFSAAFLALRGDARGLAVLEAELVTPCPEDPARAVAAAFALLELGASEADARWRTLAHTAAEGYLARGAPRRATLWIEADAALRAWRAAPTTFRLARLHFELLVREEHRRIAPLDDAALARAIAELQR